MSAKRDLAALGLRVKSGWAMAILLAGPSAAARLVTRQRLELTDPSVAGSSQPYHAVMGAAAADKRDVEARLCQVVRDATSKALARMIAAARDSAHEVHRIGLVVGSKIDPKRIANEHIRAHALEGQLFRTALTEAAEAIDLSSVILVERNAYADAAAILERTEADVKANTAAFGRQQTGPWRADEKLAALAAWVALANK
jgi:hypothetical protein